MNTSHPAFFLWQYRVLICIVTLVVAGSALAFALLSPVKFDTSISFSIDRVSIQETSAYQYDGYYAIQAADLFSQTILSWFLTPSVLLEIYDYADIDPGLTTIEELTTRFKAKKYSAQNVVVRYVERDRATAEKIASALTTVIEERAATSNQTAQQESVFAVSGAIPVITEKSPSPLFTGIVGLIAGILLGCIAAYTISGMRVHKASEEHT
ncbi:MAG: hypothetical protein V1685_00360 [Parcubacteria group bacterium]